MSWDAMVRNGYWKKRISNEPADKVADDTDWSNRRFDSVVLSDDRLIVEASVVGLRQTLLVFRRQDTDWVLEQEVSIREIIAAGDRKSSLYDSLRAFSLDDEALAVHMLHVSEDRRDGSRDDAVYLLRWQNGKWQSQAALPFSDIVNDLTGSEHSDISD